MELPIDHFRLLGVSPSAEAETVLRTLQLRLDRPPKQGFTNEVLTQRAELLRLSADLLTDQVLREKYESALLAGAAGLELSSSREVAGLILLWEADASVEAFRLACKALRPPQAPALGSGREADLTLVASLSCKAAALQEQEQRRYQSAAVLLKEGVQLLQRMGKLPDERENIQKELEALIPYRILDLLSRDSQDQRSHQEGIELLDNFVCKRGGLEGKGLTKKIDNFGQKEFEIFFQQIRKFLTVQEQADLFKCWQKSGSTDAGFLAVIALTAAGFSRRKPKLIEEARRSIKSLNLQGIDSMPLIGCLDLLLADISQAERNFLKTEDEDLRDWLKNYPQEKLAAICNYCRDWLSKDVLPGYKDIDSNSNDLESWFNDRDVQEYINNYEKKGALGIAKAGFSFLSSLSKDKEEEKVDFNQIDSEVDLDIPSSYISEEEGEDIIIDNKESNILNGFPRNILRIKSTKSLIFLYLSKLKIPKYRNYSILLIILAVVYISVFTNRNRQIQDLSRREKVESFNESDSIKSKENNETIDLEDDNKIYTESIEKKPSPAILPIEVLDVDEPTQSEVKTLLEDWLKAKALILSGLESDSLEKVARNKLVDRVKEERAKDIALGQIQKINVIIKSINIVSQTKKRIEVKTSLLYTERRLNASGASVSETYIPNLKVTYVIGREGLVWQLVDYISGG